MYRLTDQVRDLALGYADVHVQQKARPRALCEFDGEKWTPIEIVNESQLDNLQPTLRQLSNANLEQRDSAYASTAGSSVGRSSPPERRLSGHSARSTRSLADADIQEAQMHVVTTFRRSSAFKLPGLEVEQYDPEEDDILEEEFDDVVPDEEESQDVLRDLIVQQRAEPATESPRRPSILSSPTYQRNLINFADLAVSEVDLSEEPADCDLALSRRHIISAFPKQFAAEAKSPQPLTSFSVYSRAEDYVEMLHVVLVLESRTVFWKFMGPSTRPLDRVTTLPYCWAAELDLPPLSLDEPKVTDEVECLIMGRATYSTIPCDNHNDECRKCKGLASEDDCFACDGTGIFKKKPCVMCSGNGQYFCSTCKNSGHISCKTCGSSTGPKPILRQAYITCTRETVVSPTMEVEGDNKITLITTAKALAKQTIEAESFSEGTLPVAACGVLIRQRGHIVCATDIASGARGLFEVVPELDRVEFKGQLAPIVQAKQPASNRPASIKSNNSAASGKSKKTTSSSSWFGGGGGSSRKEEADADDSASIRSTASSRMRNVFRRNK